MNFPLVLCCLVIGLSLDSQTVSGTLADFELLNILHKLFPSRHPGVPPIIIAPVHPVIDPSLPVITEEPPAKLTTTSVHLNTDHDVILETTTEPHLTTQNHETPPAEKNNDELRRDVLHTVAQITDILLRMPSKAQTVVSVILPMLGDIIDRASGNPRILKDIAPRV